MKIFNKTQTIFLLVVCCGVSTLIASVLVYWLNGVPPLKIVSLWRYSKLWEAIFSRSSNTEIMVSAFLSLGVGFAASLALPLLALVKLNSAPKQTLHGDARFATDSDIRQSKSVTWGDDSGKGIVIGKYKGKLLRYIQPDFVSLGAGTRAGKGAAVVMPNAMEWQGSMILLDLKQECYNITSKYRQQVLGNEVFLFNPFSEKSHGMNPLFYIDLNHSEGLSDLLGIAEIFYSTGSTTGAEKHFNNSAQSLFIAYVSALWYFITYQPGQLRAFNIKPVYSIGTALDLYYQVAVEEIVDALADALAEAPSPKYCPESIVYVVQGAHDKLKSFTLLGDDVKGSVTGTFEKELRLFTFPNIRKATDKNDFDFRQVRRKKITIYLGVTPKDVEIAPVVLNLFFNLAIKTNLSENPDFDSSLKIKTLLLMDEFPSIGKINYVKNSAGYIAGYMLQLLTIYQTEAQKNEIYGVEGNNVLKANHSCRVNYSIVQQVDAESLERELGNTTPKSKSKSKTTNNAKTSRGESESDAKRPLMYAQELKLLPDTDEIILLKGEHPIYCKKAFYYNDDFFMNKLIALSPTLQSIKSKLGKGEFPKKEDLALSLERQELEAIVSF
ncbi:type IV secretory system conjugative DNA transfer family protein [Pseudomonas amygdali pv. morsprunorum]|uniref:type IV secretory system conjugative DNA transfer family protein n=1 Tax=Pseudomonas amygdali TaxID=47877 RepID=UPI002890CBC5|nr:type IV secretory system conjugative DNA transfer family protein [Pseudomonas amygdali]MDT3268731.1 type IV secretory system conjugative DNA transfer family protein [Pseudomonas amygdali pv. morsprunorum]